MSDPTTVLARLRQGGADGPVARLARLVVDQALARPVRELVDVDDVTRIVHEALAAASKSDRSAAHAVSVLARLDAAAAAEKRQVSAVLPPALQAGARSIAKIDVLPPRQVVMKLLDREPLRALLHAQVVDMLTAFGRKAASPMADTTIARGFSGLSKLALGKGTDKKPSALGALASAVSGEVERQVEARAKDFAETAVRGALAGFAAQVSDPANARDQAALREALLDGFFELTFAEAGALVRGSHEERVGAVRTAVAAWAASPGLRDDVRAVVDLALGPEMDRLLRDVLEDLGLAETAPRHAAEILEQRLTHVVATDAFAGWVADLMA